MSDDDKLYAGKFKTVEDLENGYKNSAAVFEENENLKRKLSEVASVPDDYQTPSDLSLPDELVGTIKEISKRAGLNQSQYEKLARESKERNEISDAKFKEAQKELGEENLNILKDFIGKNYPGKVSEAVLKQAIVDKEARAAILAQRQVLLNSSVPGMQRPGHGGYNITKDDVLKARENLQKRPHDMKARDAYLNITSQYANQSAS